MQCSKADVLQARQRRQEKTVKTFSLQEDRITSFQCFETEIQSKVLAADQCLDGGCQIIAEATTQLHSLRKIILLFVVQLSSHLRFQQPGERKQGDWISFHHIFL